MPIGVVKPVGRIRIRDYCASRACGGETEGLGAVRPIEPVMPVEANDMRDKGMTD